MDPFKYPLMELVAAGILELMVAFVIAFFAVVGVYLLVDSPRRPD